MRVSEYTKDRASETFDQCPDMQNLIAQLFTRHSESSSWLGIHQPGIDSYDQSIRGPITPLYFASCLGFYDIVQRLVVDEDIDAVGGPCGTPLQVACLQGRIDIVRLLLDRGALSSYPKEAKRSSTLYCAVCGCHKGIVQLLLDQGADVNDRVDEEDSPLYKAAKNGSCEIIDLLLDHGASIDDGHNAFDWSPLIAAVRRGRLAATELLLKRGAKRSP